MWMLAVVGVVMLGLQVTASAQGQTNLSGRWTFNQEKSDRGIGGATGPQGALTFPSFLVIKQSPTEVAIEAGNIRQDGLATTYKLDGTQVSTTTAGIKMTGKAAWEGGKLVVRSARSYSSPVGEVTVELREAYSLDGSALIVEKTQTQDGKARSNKAIYDKTTS